MRAAAIADLHVLSDRLTGPHGHRAILGRAVSEARVSGVRLFLCAGDLAGITIPHWTRPAERNLLVEIAQSAAEFCPFVAVRGNHDPDGDHAVLNAIAARFPIVYVEGEAQVVEVEGAVVLCVPWIDRTAVPRGVDYEEAVVEVYRKAIAGAEADLLAAREAGLATFLLAHAAIRGAAFGEDQPVVPVKDPTVPRELIGRPDLFDAIVVGHYHGFQIIEAGAPIVYPGSTAVNVFGEDSRKGWTLIDTETGEITLREIPQAVRLTIDLDATSGVVQAVRPWGPGPAPSLGAIAAFLAESAGHVKIRANIPEEALGTARIRIEETRALLAPVALSLRIETDVVRAEVVRDGAEEVARAETLGDKCAAFWANTDPRPGHKHRARALEILVDIEAAAREAPR